MLGILLKAAAFVFIIFIGIFVRKIHMVGPEAGDAVKKLMLNFTLPCALITSFSRIESVSVTLLLLTVLGIGSNIIMIIVGGIASRGRKGGDRAMYMLSCPAYNIGAFCLPFVQEFLPAMGVAASCMFDAGNSIMCTGGTYAFVSEYTADAANKHGFDVKMVLKRLSKSVAFLVYVAMFILTCFNIHLPEEILTILTPASNANACMAMLMIGLTFHLELKGEYISDIVKMIVLRQIWAFIFAAFCYFALPFDLVIRQALVIVAFGPMSAIAPAFTSMCNGDEGKASAANSLTIILSIIEITVVLIVLGIY